MRDPRGTNIQNIRLGRYVIAVVLCQRRDGWFVYVIHQLGNGIKALVVAGIAPGKVLLLKGPRFRPGLNQSNGLDGELVGGRIARQAPHQDAPGTGIPASVLSTVRHLDFRIDVAGVLAADDAVVNGLPLALFGIVIGGDEARCPGGKRGRRGREKFGPIEEVHHGIAAALVIIVVFVVDGSSKKRKCRCAMTHGKGQHKTDTPKGCCRKREMDVIVLLGVALASSISDRHSNSNDLQ
mmetsp:Transcript_19186/g.41695  ORF Transcript_19186/g.41695 Transcript_19186/m.41695 type:complete len:238 (+) Transcript_19186:707-1420(+)